MRLLDYSTSSPSAGQDGVVVKLFRYKPLAAPAISRGYEIVVSECRGPSVPVVCHRTRVIAQAWDSLHLVVSVNDHAERVVEAVLERERGPSEAAQTARRL